MGLFGGSGGRGPANAVAGTAVILASQRKGETWRRGDSETILDLELNYFGTRKYWFTFEVRVPGREPYTVEGEFKVPKKAENTGWLPGRVGNKLDQGLELPVRVDAADPSSLRVDWDAFLADPGRKQAQRAAEQRGYNARVAEMTAKNPKLHQTMIANNRQALPVWAAAVRAGKLSREEFEKTVNLELECGRMDPADAAAARASLD
jgi:hypothetical protein